MNKKSENPLYCRSEPASEASTEAVEPHVTQADKPHIHTRKTHIALAKSYTSHIDVCLFLDNIVLLLTTLLEIDAPAASADLVRKWTEHNINAVSIFVSCIKQFEIDALDAPAASVDLAKQFQNQMLKKKEIQGL